MKKLKSVILSALVAACALLAPAPAAAVECDQLAGSPNQLGICLPRYGTDGDQWGTAIIDALTLVNSSVPVNSTMAVATHGWIQTPRISGVSTGTAGIRISSSIYTDANTYALFQGSVTVSSAAGMGVTYGLTAGSATISAGVTASSYSALGMGFTFKGGQSFAATPSGWGRLYGLSGKGATLQGETGSTVQWSILEAAGGLYHAEGTSTELRLMPDGGNVALGSRNAADSLFHISGSNARQTIEITNNTGIGALAFQDNTGSETAFLSYNDSLGDIVLNRTGISSMTMTNAGALTYAGGNVQMVGSAERGFSNTAAAANGFFFDSAVNNDKTFIRGYGPVEIRTYDGSAYTTGAVFTGSGAAMKVGIGTTVPGAKLHVSSGVIFDGAEGLNNYGAYQSSGTPGANLTCSSGQYLDAPISKSGITTSGTCTTLPTGAAAVTRSTSTPSGSSTSSSLAVCVAGSTGTITLTAQGLACGYSGSISNTSGPGVAWGFLINGSYPPGMSSTKGFVDHLNGISSNGTNASSIWQSTGTYTGTLSYCMTLGANSGTSVVPGATNTSFSDLGQFHCNSQ